MRGNKFIKSICCELAKRILQGIASCMPQINPLVRSNYDRIQILSGKFQYQFWQQNSVTPFVRSETGIIFSFFLTHCIGRGKQDKYSSSNQRNRISEKSVLIRI